VIYLQGIGFEGQSFSVARITAASRDGGSSSAGGLWRSAQPGVVSPGRDPDHLNGHRGDEGRALTLVQHSASRAYNAHRAPGPRKVQK
jgi:hypothetical protein